MEARTLQMKRLPLFATALLASTKTTEVFRTSWSDIVKKFKDNAALGLATDGDVKKGITWCHGY